MRLAPTPSIIKRARKRRQRRKLTNLQSDERLVLNVGGYRHEIMSSTISTSPDTRLYWTTQKRSQSPDYDATTGEFYFDRNPIWFPYILNYYRLGKIHCPVDVCGAQFEEELQYWGIEERFIDSCCWDRYNKHKEANFKLSSTNEDVVDEVEQQSMLSDIESQFIEHERFQTFIDPLGDTEQWMFVSLFEKIKRKYKSTIWNILEEPNSCKTAKLIAAISLIFIVLSVTTFCLETLPRFRNQDSQQYKIIAIIEAICATWFTIEYVLRLMTCPNKLKFMKNIMNWIDLCAVLPFFISIALPDRVKSIVVLRVVRLIRVIRVLKLSRHSFGLQILGHTLKASCRELCLLVFFLSIGVIIFSSLIYYAEKDVLNTKFTSIPTSFWWSIVTMTTIGYGDVVPQTLGGKVIGTLCALCGVLVVALPVPVVVSNFSLYYSHAQSKLRFTEKNTRANENKDHVSYFNTWFNNPGVTHRSSMVSNASRNSWYMATSHPASPLKPTTPQLCYEHFSPGLSTCTWRSSLPNSPFFGSDMEQFKNRERKLSMPGINERRGSSDTREDGTDRGRKSGNALKIPGSRSNNAELFDFSKDKLQKRLNISSNMYGSQYLTPNSYHSSATATPSSSNSYWENPLSSTSGYSEQLTSSTTVSPNSTTHSSKATPNIIAMQNNAYNHLRRSSVYTEEHFSTPRSNGSYRETWSKKVNTKNLEEVSKRLETYLKSCDPERTSFQLSSIENSSLCARRKARKSKDETSNDLVIPIFTIDGPSDSSRESCSLKDEEMSCTIIPVSPKVVYHKNSPLFSFESTAT
ncbi:voltage-gated potassium channel KCNC1-like isoform X1 [Clytia hemisphaerica]